MKGILGLLLLLPINANYNQSHFNTTAYIQSAELLVKSTYNLDHRQLIKVKNLYLNIKKRFNKRLSKKQLSQCSNNPPIIAIVSLNDIQNSDIFEGADLNHFGRYMFWDRTIYIAYQMFERPEWLAHELAHHFYQDCGIKFGSLKDEHKEVYKFQKHYKDIIRK